MAKDPEQITALALYRVEGKNVTSLIGALESMATLSNAESSKQLDELIKKICLAGQGMQDSIHLGQDELLAFAQFLFVVCRKDVSATDLLGALKQTATQCRKLNKSEIIDFLATAKKVVPKLVTHLQKSRNPDAVVDSFVAGARSRVIGTTIDEIQTRRITATDANLVGQRWFWEPTVWLDNSLTQWVDVVATNKGLDWFWRITDSSELPLPKTRLPTSVDSLSHQLLFEKGDGSYVSLTPLTSVGSLSMLASSTVSRLLWRDVHNVEYGGTNARNIAAIMMDRSGQIRHPVNAPWIPPRLIVREAVFKKRNPTTFVRRHNLQEIEINRLFAIHVEQATNDSRTERLFGLLAPILEQSCVRLLQWREFIGGQGDVGQSDDATSLFTKWANNSKQFSRTESLELADSVLATVLPNCRTRDFQRWQELVGVTQEWLMSV